MLPVLVMRSFRDVLWQTNAVRWHAWRFFAMTFVINHHSCDQSLNRGRVCCDEPACSIVILSKQQDTDRSSAGMRFMCLSDLCVFVCLSACLFGASVLADIWHVTDEIVCSWGLHCARNEHVNVCSEVFFQPWQALVGLIKTRTRLVA